MLRFDRVHEKNKQRLRLRESGYSGLSLLFTDLHITPTLIRCLLNQILHTGLLIPVENINYFYFLSISERPPVLMKILDYNGFSF